MPDLYKKYIVCEKRHCDLQFDI